MYQTIVATAIPKITDDFHSLDEATWYGSAFFMTTAGFLSACKQHSQHYSQTKTDISSRGQGLQVLPAQAQLPPRHVHLRSRLPHLRRCTKQQSPHRWTSHHRCWRSGPGIGRLYHCRLLDYACEASPAYGHHRSILRNRKCCWTYHRWCSE